MTARRRADLLLVERGLFDSRARAQAAIAGGGVTADGVAVRRPSERIAVSAALTAVPDHPYVSRGGVKLAFALDHFAIDPAGALCLDVGASTGGFTDVLLRRGARHVHAVDVGTGQLHARLRGRAAVTAHERTDIRALSPDALGAVDGVVIDVSFIALCHVLPAAARFAAPRAWLIALIKPQFEAGPAHVKKGVVRSAAIYAKVCDDAMQVAAALGFDVHGIVELPLRGGDGNREFLLGAHRG